MRTARRHVAEANARSAAPNVIPPGWHAGTLGDVSRLQPGYAFKSEWFAKSGVRLLRGTNIEPGRTRWQDVVYLPVGRADEFVSYRLHEGDVVIAMDRPLISTGLKVAALGVQDVPSLLLQRVGRFHCDESVERRFLIQYLRSQFFIQHIDRQSTGTQLPHISGTDIETAPLVLPPISEQRRIVAKLETLQARSGRAHQALDVVPPLLEKLRQSILAAAFRGDLTKDWRAKNRNVEPASELLKRIRIERRKKWEESELAKMKAKGKTPADDKWKAKYKEPEPVDASGLPELPEGWCWASVEDVALVGGGLTKNASKRSGGSIVPLVSVAAVQLRRIELEGASSILLGPEDGDKGELRAGDLLIVEGNGSLSHIGRVALWNDEIPGARHQNHLIRVRPVLVSPGYMLEWLASPLGRQAIIKQATSAAGLYTLSLSKVDALPVPLAPLEEQAALIHVVQDAVGQISSLSVTAHGCEHDLKTFERAILARAFRGELVPQDPNDEPAEEMLKRVRGEIMLSLQRGTKPTFEKKRKVRAGVRNEEV